MGSFSTPRSPFHQKLHPRTVLGLCRGPGAAEVHYPIPKTSDPNTDSDHRASVMIMMMSQEIVCVCVWSGVGGAWHTDQYIISYKLNSTWIDPEGVCDRLRTVDECTVNPTDQYGGDGGGGGRVGGGLSLGFLHGGRGRHEDLDLEG